MKFFNWILRKPHQSTNYTMVSYNKDASCVEGVVKVLEWDTETLLNQMLDGFLTIGTLGNSNPLLLSPIQEEDQNAAAFDAAKLEIEAEAQSDVEAHDEPKALPVEKFVQAPAIIQHMQVTSHPIEVDTIKISPFEEHKRPSTEIIEPLLIKGPDTCQRTTLADLLAVEAEIIEPLLIKGPDTCQRTTLADLLAVEAEIISPTIALAEKKQSSETTKMGKKVLLNRDCSATLELPAIKKKIHRLMTKMLKKKIHPDLGQLKSKAMEGVQGSFSPKIIRATVSCSCYGATSHFSRNKRDPYGNEIAGTVF